MSQTPTGADGAVMSITTACDPSGVRFRRDGDRLSVDYAPPTAWFPQHVLEYSRHRPDVGLSCDGTLVTLHAANGSWVWRLTGRRRTHRAGPAAEPLVMCEAAWPD
jgi:hypothetical protein